MDNQLSPLSAFFKLWDGEVQVSFNLTGDSAQGIVDQYQALKELLTQNGFTVQAKSMEEGQKTIECDSFIYSVTSKGDGVVKFFGSHPGLKYAFLSVYEEDWNKLPFEIPSLQPCHVTEKEIAIKQGHLQYLNQPLTLVYSEYENKEGGLTKRFEYVRGFTPTQPERKEVDLSYKNEPWYKKINPKAQELVDNGRKIWAESETGFVSPELHEVIAATLGDQTKYGELVREVMGTILGVSISPTDNYPVPRVIIAKLLKVLPTTIDEDGEEIDNPDFDETYGVALVSINHVLQQQKPKKNVKGK